MDIENDFEYVFNKNNQQGDVVDFSESGEEMEEQDDNQEQTKKRLRKKKRELALEEDQAFEEDLVNN